MRCTGIHNFLPSSVTFSPLERQFLANGLRFACTPPSSQAHIYRNDYLNNPTRGWQRFARALDTRLLFNAAANDGYHAKFAVKRQKSQHAIDHLVDSQRQNYAAEFRLLDTYRTATLNALTAHAHSVSSYTLTRQPHNCSRADLRFLQRLMTDASITIKPADKNLGLVLVSTDWYHAEITRMLNDRTTYQPLKHFATVQKGQRGRRQILSLPQLQVELATNLKALATTSAGSLKLWNPNLCDQVQQYLTSSVTLDTCAVPAIYLLIKVHKSSGLCGRPIVPSTRWLTTPASVVVNHLLREILHEAAIPHLVKDTKSFVSELEGRTMPPGAAAAEFVTADIASLYTNIDTEDGLIQVRRFLILQNVSARHSELIMSLLEFVMRNSYLCYRDGVWYQCDGTAMGTSCAPPYADIVVYMRERDVLNDMHQVILAYYRYLDDIFALIVAAAVPEFQHRMNNLHPRLRFEFVVDAHSAAFLDLHIFKGPRFLEHGVLDLSVHQKKMNLYLYIPYRSFHTDAMKKSFILTELMRYIRNSSSIEGFLALRKLFFQRLRDRGYPSSFLEEVFTTVFYSDRQYFLWPSKELLEHPNLDSKPPRSKTLIRRVERLRAAAAISADGDYAAQQPSVFIVPYSPLTRLLPTRTLLTQRWSLVRDALNDSYLAPPIIAYQSAPSLLTTLVFQRARRLEEARRAGAAATAPAAPVGTAGSQVQTRISRFFTPRTSSALPDGLAAASPPSALSAPAAAERATPARTTLSSRTRL